MSDDLEGESKRSPESSRRPSRQPSPQRDTIEESGPPSSSHSSPPHSRPSTPPDAPRPSSSTPTTAPTSAPGPPPLDGHRTAFILDRFSLSNTIVYMSNDRIIPSSLAKNRSFYDFVLKDDENQVRGWMDAIKGLGVNDRGNPSDGGFGYVKFRMVLEGRDSSMRTSVLLFLSLDY